MANDTLHVAKLVNFEAKLNWSFVIQTGKPSEYS